MALRDAGRSTLDSNLHGRELSAQNYSKDLVLGLMDQIEQRPGMYMPDGNDIASLETWLHGYESAMRDAAANANCLGFHRAFGDFLLKTRGWSAACGWANAIKSATSTSSEAAAVFFTLLHEFRSTVPDGDVRRGKWWTGE